MDKFRFMLKIDIYKNMVRYLVKILCISYLLVSVFSSAMANNNWELELRQMKLIGQSTLKVFIWDIYDIKLLSETGKFSWQNEFALIFDYKRNSQKNDIIEASLDEMSKQVSTSSKQLEEWKVYLKGAIQSVKPESKAAVSWSPDGDITFFYENTEPIEIADREFARSFLNIWLGSETSKPQLRSSLLGIK